MMLTKEILEQPMSMEHNCMSYGISVEDAKHYVDLSRYISCMFLYIYVYHVIN